MRLAAWAAAVAMFQACTATDAARGDPDAFVAFVERLDVETSHDDPRLYWSQVQVRLGSWLEGIDDPQVVRVLFDRCVRESESRQCPPDDELGLELFFHAQYVVMRRLVLLGTEESTMVLVGILADETVHLDGESALNVCHLVSRCGRKALPFLARITSGRRAEWAAKIARCIEAGELYGP